jgi:hypothetical protein
MRAARRGALKLVPFASVPLGAWANGSSTRQLAGRAIGFYARRAYYRHHGQLPPGS